VQWKDGVYRRQLKTHCSRPFTCFHLIKNSSADTITTSVLDSTFIPPTHLQLLFLNFSHTQICAFRHTTTAPAMHFLPSKIKTHINTTDHHMHTSHSIIHGSPQKKKVSSFHTHIKQISYTPSPFPSTTDSSPTHSAPHSSGLPSPSPRL
jgi:hypothetical protein